ncbi:Serine/threonine-protein kinase hal4 [Tolypocladium capitatum]|uniref:non-specific serine/threonine protein kinase n=1 Tax=Tolypocladium capitatum TaxID=45235 RepID=A0A2K3QDX5_9HYPO|nr:Serine/threonine-protein kinase hal4 [Tolypocladium capitatum]
MALSAPPAMGPLEPQPMPSPARGPAPCPRPPAPTTSPSAAASAATATATAAVSIPAAASEPPAELRPYCPSSYSSSPRQFPSDITDPILEEGGEDSGSDSPIEPVTPVSGGRHSQDFTTTLQHAHDVDDGSSLRREQTPQHPPSLAPKRVPLLVSHASAPPAATPTREAAHAAPTSTPSAADPDPPPQTPRSRRSTRGSASSFKRTISNLFRRSSSAVERERERERAREGEYAVDDSPPSSATDTTRSSSGLTLRSAPPPKSGRHFSSNKSSNTTRSNSPPGQRSPVLEMTQTHPSVATPHGSLPIPDDFKKNRRSATGLAIDFVGAAVARGRQPPTPRRASSFDATDRAHAPAHQNQGGDDEQTYPPERLPWALAPDVGTGAKARRMSLCLPDDFTIDIAELQSEFEYQHKILGRHGKHLGKGAASKVTLMMRKGSPVELYAVKEFRGKSHRESQEDYEKKIKSEFVIAKSLHHPNIVETVRLCTDHGRWNHVMEYCSEGDLFSLVQKGHLKGEDKKKDRLCLFKQMMQGIGYLHANGVAHRDIKLENLLLTKESKLKITDFGVSEVFSGMHPGLRESGGQCGQNMTDIRLCAPGICGSEPYIAPEVLEKKREYDPRALDVWSAAIVMIYLTFGGAIWSRAERGNQHYDKLVTGWRKWNDKHPECDACITDTDYPTCLALDVGVNPPALRRLLLQMLNPDPNKRIGADEVLGNRWMRNVECCQVESYDDPALTIDATKKDCCSRNGSRKIFCHNHLPLKSMGSHSLGKMPGTPGY